MSNDERTRAYVIRQLANGRTKRDVVSRLKLAIAREMLRLTDDATRHRDFRPARQTNIT
jgi:hypothetical protein